MSIETNRQWVIAQRPQGAVTETTFELRRAPIPEPMDGQALVRVAWLGIDATQRTWLNPAATYAQPVALGEPMRGSGVGRVVASRTDRLAVGDWVYGTHAWQDYIIAGDEACSVSTPCLPG